jgi:hypothetical protein
MNKIEKIAGEIMHLIYKEHDSCISVDAMRPHSEVLAKLYKKHQQEEMNDAFRLLAGRGYTSMRGTERGQICYPSDPALDHRESVKDKKKNSSRWRVGIFALIMTCLIPVAYNSCSKVENHPKKDHISDNTE